MNTQTSPVWQPQKAMNVFEDLIIELQNENLLEDTSSRKEADDEVNLEIAEPAENPPLVESPGDDDPILGHLSEMEKPLKRSEFFRKRAVDEVSALQMVDHILSGIEREHMKIVPNAFDDFEAKKALNKFLQVSEDFSSNEHVQAEFALMHETEAWSSALVNRDREISVANLRRFCEESKPALSSQALLSLARFYRNAPFNEDVRAKFEFIMTRLFARESDYQKRIVIFEREEMIGHIKTFYADWSSVALYEQTEDDAEFTLSVMRFEDLAREAESADTFDELLENDFFGKVRDFKEETAELFFAPEITAAAVNCNARIGNKYVDLIQKEKLRTSPKLTAEKYGVGLDESISKAAGKSMSLRDVLRSDDIDFDAIEERRAVAEQIESVRFANSFLAGNVKFSIFGVNKWLLAATILTVILSVGAWYWVETATSGDTAVKKAAVVTIEDEAFRKYLQTARSSNDKLYGVVLSSWNDLEQPAKEEYLKKGLAYAETKGFTTVHLLNDRGRTVGFATKDKIEIMTP